MTLVQELSRIETRKFSFSKSTEFSHSFARNCGALSMYDNGFGLGIPLHISTKNKLLWVFREMMNSGGTFLFNISGVDIKKAIKGFINFEEAEGNNQVTEWELFMILTNKGYLEQCIFHNGSVQLKQEILWNALM